MSRLPTVGNVHTLAQAMNPEARVVYVDTDPVAVRYSRQLLDRDKVPHAAAIEADLRDPAAILAHPRAPAARPLPAHRAYPGGGAALHPRRRRGAVRGAGPHGGAAGG